MSPQDAGASCDCGSSKICLRLGMQDLGCGVERFRVLAYTLVDEPTAVAATAGYLAYFRKPKNTINNTPNLYCPQPKPPKP